MYITARELPFEDIAPLSMHVLRPIAVKGLCCAATDCIRDMLTLKEPGGRRIRAYLQLHQASMLIDEPEGEQTQFGVYRNRISQLPLSDLEEYGKRTSLGHMLAFAKSLGMWVAKRLAPDAYTFVLARGRLMWMGEISRMPSGDAAFPALRIWLHPYEPDRYFFGSGRAGSATETTFVLPTI